MRIAVGADGNGIRLKDRIKEHLIELGHEVADHGALGEDDIDYPDVAVVVANAVADGSAERAVLVCGTGLGMAIAANKVAGVRAASVTDPYSAERAMKSNDARVLCLGARVVGAEVATLLVDHWIVSEFQGGASTRKVDKLKALDATREGEPA